ncbi:MAG: hypothetical protein IH849_01130 [Acidobacteria bacterium]|nr:hypothetical protein [Acidobacteriota bacterium]
MSSYRRNTALISSIAVVALMFTGTAWAGAQAVSEQSRIEATVSDAAAQQAGAGVVRQRVHADAEAAARLVQEMRVRPTIALSSSFSRRSGGMASRALANAEEIGLSEEQEEQIRGLQRENRRAQIRRNADTQIAEMDLEEMMSTESSDLDVIEQMMRAIANYEVDERIARLRLDRSAKAILTEAQRDELEEMSPARFIFESIRR